VNVLLDTHIALWAIVDDVRLSAKAREWLLAPEATLWVSAASVWEIAIKHSLGRERMPISGQMALHCFEQSGYRMLAIRPEHAVAVERLPLIHTDPFDRLLVAQAVHEPMHLLTHDSKLVGYGPAVVLV
jgi:PIN domain nuclease of toxin-antitoxin system